MAVKTLLVGLGGTGCEIVSRVKKMIDTSDPNVQFVGFDTDGSWEGTDGLPVIYTSREMTVRQYLNDVDNWEEWFPDNAMLKVRNMIKGAGQVRPLSRLAFAETISSGRIGKLEKAIRELQVSRGDVQPSNFRIMIVSSFAGGTGSGMFIQTALFLREYIRKHYGGEVIIRGMFALPDLFKDVNPSKVQRESMYANAYAALKELSAINQVCLSNDPAADDINMQIDNLFDSKRDRRKAEKKPFDFIFFVDNINSRGKVLTSIDDYKQLMTTATYMQVYSPMTDSGDSREDNAILTVISGDGKPLYGGVGASRIVYPYKDLVDYCGTRATIEAISDSWTLVDREYQKANADNKKLMVLDPTVKELDRHEHFITTVNSMLEEGNTRLSFITKAITDISEDGRQTDRADAFYEYVYNFVLDKIKGDEDVKTKGNEAGVTEKQLKGNLATNVTRCETALKDYLDTINSRIVLLRSSIVQSIIPDDLSSAVSLESDWNIMKLVTSGGHIVHPLAIRMLLYKFRARIVEELDRCTADTTSNLKKINDYFKNAYDIKGTEAVESATDRANQNGAFKKAKFRAEYLVKSAAQKSRLDKYRNSKIISIAFGDILKRLDAVIEQFEKLFDSLEDIKTELQSEVSIFEEKTHTNTAEAAIYLCSSPEEKRDLYDSLNFSCSDSNDNGVYDLIFYSLYESGHKALENAKNKAVAKLSEKDKLAERNEKMSKIFRDSVVKRNISDVAEKCADKLDLDVYDALEKSAEGDQAKIHEVVESAYEKALPYLMYSLSRKIVSLSAVGGDDDEDDSAYTLTFWGIHPEVAEKIIKRTGMMHTREFFIAGASGDSPEVVSDTEYSKYEISCYEALYCVALTEIPKFAETGDSFGVFYENYSSRINKMIKKDKTALTPHLDIRWHRRNYLPMISSDKNHEDDLRAARGIWLALIYGGLPEETKKGKKVLYASFARMSGKSAIPEESYESRDVLYNGSNIQITNVYELYKALQLDEITILRFIEVFEKSFDEDKETGLENMEFVGPRARKFVKGLVSSDNSDRNALNMIARFVSHAKATDKEKKLFVQALQSLIEEFCAELTEERQAELRSLIYKASRFGNNKANRAKLERFINFEYWEGNND